MTIGQDRSTCQVLRNRLNLLEHSPRPGLIPDCAHLASYGWRSISAVFGWAAFVFHVSVTAPAFISSRGGTLNFRRFE
jgi:hypothetical protein